MGEQRFLQRENHLLRLHEEERADPPQRGDDAAGLAAESRRLRQQHAEDRLKEGNMLDVGFRRRQIGNH